MMRTNPLPSVTLRAVLTLAIGSLGVSCTGQEGTGPGAGGSDPGTPPGTTISASVVAYDASAPAPPAALGAAAAITIEGTVTATGVTVELWDGIEWRTAVDGMATASFAVGDATVETTLVPATEIPAGTYSRVRIGAEAATIELSVSAQGQQFEAAVATPSGQSVTIEKDVEAVENPDGSRTFRVSLETIASLSLRTDANGVSLVVDGDFGSAVLPQVAFAASITAADVSAPTAPGLSAIEGTVTMERLTVELWDGAAWLTVVDGMATASFAVADATAEATLMTATEIAAGDYTQVRLTGDRATVTLSATVNGQIFEASAQTAAGQSVEITKDIEVVVNADGSRTFRFTLETVHRVTVEPDRVIIDGDFGSHALPRGSVVTSIAAADVSSPVAPGLSDVDGTVTLENIIIELWNGAVWLTVVDGMATASFAVADATAEATLMPATEIPAGTYSRVRLTADRATVRISATVNGRLFEATALTGPEQSIEITRDVEVSENPDGSRTLRFALETVRRVAAEPGQVIIEGDFGTHTLR